MSEQASQSPSRVVITGLGAISPLGRNKSEILSSLRAGASGIRFIEKLEELKFSCQVGGLVHQWQELAEKILSESDRFAMSESMQFAAIAAFEALDDAGLQIPTSEEPADVDRGAIIGTGIGGLDVFSEKVYPNVESKRVKRCGGSVVEQIMCSGVSAKLGGLLGLGNQVTTNSSACNTGTEAIVMGYDRIRHGEAEIMIVGGAEAGHYQIWSGFDAMRVLARKWNDEPHKASRPMSADSAGFVPGSGAGILVLESLASAERRGAPIYAEILSGFLCSGGMRQGGSMTAPSSEGVKRCIRQAILRAGIDASDIDYINGHLTSTFADPLEISNWQQSLELPTEQFPWINSTKSLMGHALGAAGAIESVATLLQLKYSFLHPSLNCETLHEAIEPIAKRVVRERLDLGPKDLKIAAKASFGFGDVNSCLILKKWS